MGEPAPRARTTGQVTALVRRGTVVKIVMEAYQKRDKFNVLEYLGVIHKEYKSVNIIDQCCIVFFHVNYEGMELYTVEQWVKVITEGPDNTYFPVNNPSVENGKNKIVAPERE